MHSESIFPVSMQLWVRFTDVENTLLREIPFRYTVKSAKHWGLLKKAFRHNGARRLTTPTNSHFDKYAGVIANIVLQCLTDTDWVTVQIVGPNLIDNHRQKDIYGTKNIHRYLLRRIERKHKHKAFYVLQGLMSELLRGSVMSFASVYLDKKGYRAQKKPRKYLHENRKEWKDYKGLQEALLTKGDGYITVAREYHESLLKIRILPEILKHANKRLFWTVNTSEQAIEAKLLYYKSIISVRSEEPEELEL
jgi:hypothetical protein